jgi:Sap, sulfolipid-1-addressing protein
MDGWAIGQSLPLAIGVALSPISIVAVVLLLTTPRARANGPAFLLGLGVVGAVVLALAGPGEASELPRRHRDRRRSRPSRCCPWRSAQDRSGLQ